MTVHYQTSSSLSRTPLSRKRGHLFAPICGDEACEPMDVYITATVNQGGNIVKVFRCLLVPVLVCAAHRLNSMVAWGVGINGSEEHCRNLGLCVLIKRASSLVSKFSHSSVASEALKDVQREMDTELLQSSRSNEAMYACAFPRLPAKSS